jgi:hypothetical protein
MNGGVAAGGTADVEDGLDEGVVVEPAAAVVVIGTGDAAV